MYSLYLNLEKTKERDAWQGHLPSPVSKKAKQLPTYFSKKQKKRREHVLHKLILCLELWFFHGFGNSQDNLEREDEKNKKEKAKTSSLLQLSMF